MPPASTPSASAPFWRRHSRLALGIAVAVVTGMIVDAVFRAGWRLSYIFAFDAGALATIVALYVRFRGASFARMKQDAVGQDAGQYAVLAFVLVAATVGLVAVATELPRVKEAENVEKVAHALLVVVTIVLSWSFIHTIFALHYAHDYFVDVKLPPEPGDKAAGRLLFPGGGIPSYSDFLYFAFTIGMTFQVSDVQIADPAIRRIVLLHGVVAFFYTTGIVALAINLVAGLL